MSDNDYSAQPITDSPESDMTIEERLEKARNEAMEAYSLAHKQVYAQFWEQRRYEIATAAMQGLLACGDKCSKESVARLSVEYADALINELKRK